MGLRDWWRGRAEEQRIREAAEFERLTYVGSVLMTQAQALTAATWVVRGGDEPPAPDRELRNLFLANTIALGIGPRARDVRARDIWELIATVLDVSPVADYPTVNEYFMNSAYFDANGIEVPGYEFLAFLQVSNPDADAFALELRNLSVAHRDDMPTMFLQQLSSRFGVRDPSRLPESTKILLLHAGFTLKTVAEDTQNAPDAQREQRMALASEFEGRLLALALRTKKVSFTRIRWQETWGEQLSGVIEGAHTHDEAIRLLPRWATDWFPDGHELAQDPDSPDAWVATSIDGRRLWFFLERILG